MRRVAGNIGTPVGEDGSKFGERARNVIQLDGASGEGGGQIIRSALTLSMLSGQPFTILNIRARRKNPGLQRQHLTAVLAAAKVCDAKLQDAKLQSSRLSFWPGAIRAGNFDFDIHSAGSSTLVLQTIGPALSAAPGPSTVTVRGGTHNPMAPPFEFLAKAFVPAITRMGAQWDLSLLRHGFYPAGGGGIVAHIEPSPWRGLQLTERPDNYRVSAKILVSQLPEDVAQREKQWLRRHMGIPAEKIAIEKVSANSPGNVVLVSSEGETHTEIFSSLGERGKRAEHVAEEAFDAWKSFDDSQAPVGEHLADQLLLPMTLAAIEGRRSRFRTHVVSDHVRTHVELLQTFYPNVAIRIEPLTDTGEFTITVELQ